MVHCPITDSINVKLVQKIETGEIVSLYDLFGIQTRDIFQGIEHVYKYYSIESGYGFFYPFSIQGKPLLYETLENFEWYYQKEKWEHIKSLELIQPSDKVLEIGCGQGSFLASVKKKCGTEPVGLELNQSAVDRAVSSGLSVFNEEMNKFASSNLEAFDVICFFQVLEHIADPIKFLQEALIMLRNGGRLIISVPDNDSLVNRDDENALNFPPHHMGLWNRKSLTFLSKALPIEIQMTVNEPLQANHVDWYVRTLLKKIFGRHIYYHVISKTIIPSIIKKRVQANALQIHGHTILAVYKK